MIAGAEKGAMLSASVKIMASIASSLTVTGALSVCGGLTAAVIEDGGAGAQFTAKASTTEPPKACATGISLVISSLNGRGIGREERNSDASGGECR